MKYRILIVSANYYKEISKNLLEKAKFFLKDKAIIKVINVPGVFEIPVVISKNIKKFDGFIALGCVIKGETDHYEIVKNITYSQIYKVAYENILPLSSALLTVENYSQALERSDIKKKDLGGLAAKTCLNLIKKINE